MMQFDFDSARVSPEGELCLKIKNLTEARKFVYQMEHRTYTCELKKLYKKRSLDANAYFWVLADKLAEATRISKEEVYRHCIRDIGGNTSTVCVREKAVNKLTEGWTKNGMGWICDVIPSKLPGCKNVVLYYGSSTYDSKQMARLIDNVIQDCEAVGIETWPQEKVQGLLEKWGEEA